MDDALCTINFIHKHISRDIHWLSALEEGRELCQEDQVAATEYLFDSVIFGCKYLTAFCAHYGARLDATDMMQRNVLLKAVTYLSPNTCDIVRTLIDCGVSVNSSRPIASGVNMSAITEIMVNRAWFNENADDYHEKMDISNKVINLLFVLHADIPEGLSDKGKAGLEESITNESRAQRALSEGKSFIRLYTKQGKVSFLDEEPESQNRCAPTKCVIS